MYEDTERTLISNMKMFERVFNRCNFRKTTLKMYKPERDMKLSSKIVEDKVFLPFDVIQRKTDKQPGEEMKKTFRYQRRNMCVGLGFHNVITEPQNNIQLKSDIKPSKKHDLLSNGPIVDGEISIFILLVKTYFLIKDRRETEKYSEEEELKEIEEEICITNIHLARLHNNKDELQKAKREYSFVNKIPRISHVNGSDIRDF